LSSKTKNFSFVWGGSNVGTNEIAAATSSGKEGLMAYLSYGRIISSVLKKT
jgi:hypothetical protein